jgi:hypothetical protein
VAIVAAVEASGKSAVRAAAARAPDEAVAADGGDAAAGGPIGCEPAEDRDVVWARRSEGGRMASPAQHQLGGEHGEPGAREALEMRRCRICAGSVQAKATRIFADEGRRRDLQRNIRKYLYISVRHPEHLRFHHLSVMCESSGRRSRAPVSRPRDTSATAAPIGRSSAAKSSSLARRASVCVCV